MTDDPLEPEDDDLSDTLDGAQSYSSHLDVLRYILRTLIMLGLCVVTLAGIYWVTRPKATPDPQYVVPGLEERIRRGNELLDSAREERKQWERKKESQEEAERMLSKPFMERY